MNSTVRLSSTFVSCQTVGAKRSATELRGCGFAGGVACLNRPAEFHARALQQAVEAEVCAVIPVVIEYGLSRRATATGSAD
jgi:hypothetical protein